MQKQLGILVAMIAIAIAVFIIYQQNSVKVPLGASIGVMQDSLSSYMGDVDGTGAPSDVMMDYETETMPSSEFFVDMKKDAPFYPLPPKTCFAKESAKKAFGISAVQTYTDQSGQQGRTSAYANARADALNKATLACANSGMRTGNCDKGCKQTSLIGPTFDAMGNTVQCGEQLIQLGLHAVQCRILGECLLTRSCVPEATTGSNQSAPPADAMMDAPAQPADAMMNAPAI